MEQPSPHGLPDVSDCRTGFRSSTDRRPPRHDHPIRTDCRTGFFGSDGATVPANCLQTSPPVGQVSAAWVDRRPPRHGPPNRPYCRTSTRRLIGVGATGWDRPRRSGCRTGLRSPSGTGPLKPRPSKPVRLSDKSPRLTWTAVPQPGLPNPSGCRTSLRASTLASPLPATVLQTCPTVGQVSAASLQRRPQPWRSKTCPTVGRVFPARRRQGDPAGFSPSHPWRRTSGSRSGRALWHHGAARRSRTAPFRASIAPSTVSRPTLRSTSRMGRSS